MMVESERTNGNTQQQQKYGDNLPSLSVKCVRASMYSECVWLRANVIIHAWLDYDATTCD